MYTVWYYKIDVIEYGISKMQNKLKIMRDFSVRTVVCLDRFKQGVWVLAVD